jgi:hypothetical protein
MASRHWIFTVVLGMTVGLCALASAAHVEPASNAECVVRLQIPSYPYVARVSNSSGAVRAAVALGEGGTVQSQQFELISDPKNMKIFQPAIARALKASEFGKPCAGRTVRFTFRFKMGAADEVWFQYPDTYEITALAPLINTSGRKKQP